MPTIPSLEEMLKAGVHFGHQAQRWHPKMEQYIFAERGGIHIINLEETQKLLKEACEYLKGVVSRGGLVLFVGTKQQAQEAVSKEATRCGMPYVSERWLGGTLTNFSEIKKLIRRLRTLKEQQERGELKKYTKKEQLWLTREIEDLEVRVGGIQNLERLPEVVFVLDMRGDKTAVLEAKTVNLPIIAVCDTNINPDNADFIIPANDDATKSLTLITRLMADAVIEGRKVFETAKVQAAAAKENK
ncbi:MAG: 30S ribosomal protein S2 [Candidatus Uhrbacteria bacterium GW2011_GWE2_45_35]|uniref:Small ribosomal subunit protein uS2 n=2 Tax=Candidatus Uhriibacteriota TaxID=1752732 RepID=A0A0G1ME86_9BACT|nr:MAG: 30S ribosomal protein S2 [Candidatus Uhrbacteria bacterium GW2011_GWF2_44_350]KKU06649.1 MAG: 30S ribosomal protein S2 [Candidatus Uhrbacteria bacterium GW2011_GWE2_45_35]HBR80703.1 30S ribosomal protein S2 [Candidatus Uhrbacteria bacterium]HCU31665.1 30S ribosomal protein S2 [Candidatus Uhrbacteria bacterium]